MSEMGTSLVLMNEWLIEIQFVLFLLRIRPLIEAFLAWIIIFLSYSCLYLSSLLQYFALKLFLIGDLLFQEFCLRDLQFRHRTLLFSLIVPFRRFSSRTIVDTTLWRRSPGILLFVRISGFIVPLIIIFVSFWQRIVSIDFGLLACGSYWYKVFGVVF